MALPVEINPLQLQTSGAYSIAKSLRFRSSASAYLNRTPSVAGNQTKFTISLWFKRGALTAYGALFDAYSGAGANYGILQLQNDDTLLWFNQTASVITAKIQTNAVYRDPSAWYHVVAVYDSTQATSSNRLAMYINGVQVTSFSVATYPTLNQTNTINGTVSHDIGRYGGAANYFDGYLAEVNFIDGQALTPSSFGAYDTNGVWQPKKYSGTYGTNGFYLPFGTTTSTATLGNDSSGNGNTWTVNNISLTAGTTYDSMTDSPTVSSASVANYATLNAAYTSAITLSNGNLNYSIPVAAPQQTIGTISVTSGKWYWEVVPTSGNQLTAIGVASVEAIGNGKSYVSSTSTNPVMAYEPISGSVYVNGSIVTTTTTSAANDTVAIAYDAGANTAAIYKNNTLLYTATLTGTSRGAVAYLANPSGAQAAVGYINFGQRPFTYSAPTGFNALNTYNLPTPTIANGAKYMAATTYTGTGASLTIANSANNTIGTTFQPDFVWMKGRSGATDHALYDVVRGTTKDLVSNSTAAETTQATGLTAFGSTGFTIGALAKVNTSAATYVGWQWLAGNSSGSSNTSGSITSTVSANTTAGFSVVTYTGTGAAATIGHGLGAVASFIIIKNRQAANSWAVYHVSVGANQQLLLNSANAISADTQGFTATPSSTVFSVGTGSSMDTNQTTGGGQHVAYCWAAVAGYSAFGSYTANASTDGPFIYTGFRPRFIIFKNSSSAQDWMMFDTSRNTYNATNLYLQPDTTAADGSGIGDGIDILSNGFKIRSTNLTINGSTNTIIYAAFAENPFNSSRAR